MSITAFITGKLVNEPERRTGASGKPFVLARVVAHDGAANADKVTVIAAMPSLGHRPGNYKEADSLVLLHWALEQPEHSIGGTARWTGVNLSELGVLRQSSSPQPPRLTHEPPQARRAARPTSYRSGFVLAVAGHLRSLASRESLASLARQ